MRRFLAMQRPVKRWACAEATLKAISWRRLFHPPSQMRDFRQPTLTTSTHTEAHYLTTISAIQTASRKLSASPYPPPVPSKRPAHAFLLITRSPLLLSTKTFLTPSAILTTFQITLARFVSGTCCSTATALAGASPHWSLVSPNSGKDLNGR